MPEIVRQGASLPVVIHVHGGGWARGDRKGAAPKFMARAYAKCGFVAVSIGYRNGFQFPAHMIDLSNAVKWVINNIEMYSGDKTRLFLSGHSAGAHLVSLLALNPEYLKAVGLSPEHIRGVIAISGIYTVFEPFPGKLKNRLFRMSYTSPTFGSDMEILQRASPSYHLQSSGLTDTSYLPPFIVFNAARDYGLDHDGVKFSKLLKAKGAAVTYVHIHSTTHHTISLSDIVVDHCRGFITELIAASQNKAVFPCPDKSQANLGGQLLSVQIIDTSVDQVSVVDEEQESQFFL